MAETVQAGSTLALAQRIDAALPQTQCTRCGYPDCSAYAQAIAEGRAGINQCPPGGAEGISRLAKITGLAARPLDPAHGQELPRTLAVIDEDWCIGCTLCLKACPVDAIVGANKTMHTVIEQDCTGCELCVPVCPVDCITLENASGSRTGWQAWSDTQAQRARQAYERRTRRLGQAIGDAPAPLHQRRTPVLRPAADGTSAPAPATPHSAQPERSKLLAEIMAKARARRQQE
ncbi:ferredoxin [Lampropedia cohaerens]|uniref:Ferredoxin n=1 Tax=Lampropedia cohaerens TaxID=1610491 RepID=A0A0U1PWB6_9BURK|nr:electron transport complex subunit RsxB [Lampropedia cohaerens]KKW66781.1 ferredoxin [Lampropedia cohaerens]